MSSNNVLAIFREQKGWSQKEMASAFGVSQSQISRYESGKQEIPEHILKHLECLQFLQKEKPTR